MPRNVALLSVLLAAALLFTTACSWVAAETATVVADGEPLSGDVSAVRQDGKTLVPLRSLARALDTEVGWNSETREVILETGPFPLVMRPGHTTMHWAGETLDLGTAPVIRDGRTFLSLEVLGDWLGLPLLWDADNNCAYVHTGHAGRQISQPLYQGLVRALENDIRYLQMPAGNPPSPRTIVDTVAQVWLDHPEFFHLAPEMKLEGNRLELDLAYSGEEREALSRDLDQATQDLVDAHVSDNMDAFQQLQAVHDALAQNTSYKLADEEGQPRHHAHTAYGVLVEGEGVCSGYASALKLLLDELGIESSIVTGSATGIPHAWNLVEIDGQRGHVDATWNSAGVDAEGQRFFFNLDNDTLARTHTWSWEAYPPAQGLR